MEKPRPRVGEGCCRPQHPAVSSPRTLSLVLYSSLALSLFLLGLLTNELIITPIQAQVLSASQVVPQATPNLTPEATPSATPEPTPTEAPLVMDEDPLEQKEAIRKYIYTIFRQNAPTAFAISLAEGKDRKLYKGQVVYNVKAIRKTDAELSVGIFQINLKSKEVRVHYDRIPGTTEQEKIEWLQNPFNNVLYAFWVYSHSGFYPWSVYSDGTYLTYLK